MVGGTLFGVLAIFLTVDRAALIIRLAELHGMAERIACMRTALRDALIECGAPGAWKHITEQRGMFSYTGLSSLFAYSCRLYLCLYECLCVFLLLYVCMCLATNIAVNNNRLKATQVQMLEDQYHIFMLPSGRMSICGLTPTNVNYVARAIRNVLRKLPSLLVFSLFKICPNVFALTESCF
jgi:aspartate aminotransferase, cytoplasmic